jgi:hypothetical protein
MKAQTSKRIQVIKKVETPVSHLRIVKKMGLRPPTWTPSKIGDGMGEKLNFSVWIKVQP